MYQVTSCQLAVATLKIRMSNLLEMVADGELEVTAKEMNALYTSLNAADKKLDKIVSRARRYQG